MPIYHNLMLTTTSFCHHTRTHQASCLYLFKILELYFFRDMAEQKIIAQCFIHPFQILAIIDMPIHIQVKIANRKFLDRWIFQELILGSPRQFLDLLRLIRSNQIFWHRRHLASFKINQDKIAENVQQKIACCIVDIEHPMTEKLVVGNRFCLNGNGSLYLGRP